MKLVFGKKSCANALDSRFSQPFHRACERVTTDIASNLTTLLSGGRHPCACQPRGHGRDLGGRRVIVILGGGCGGRCQGCQMAIARFLDGMCLALRASGLWLRYATLQNLIPSFPWIAPGWRAWGRNPRKGRDQILPSGNPDSPTAPPPRWSEWRRREQTSFPRLRFQCRFLHI